LAVVAREPKLACFAVKSTAATRLIAQAKLAFTSGIAATATVGCRTH
jgi:hypothetical protein